MSSHCKQNKIPEVTFVEVDDGQVDPTKLMSHVRNNTCLVTCIMANNETGVIQVNENEGRRMVNNFKQTSTAVSKIRVGSLSLNYFRAL